MNFRIQGTFEGSPELYMDGTKIDYKGLSVLVYPEMSYQDDNGATTVLPAYATLSFSVKETIGNLEIDKMYRVNASLSKENEIVVEPIATEAAFPPKKMQKPAKKGCAKCAPGKQCADCKEKAKSAMEEVEKYPPNSREYKVALSQVLAQKIIKHV